jgi:pentose-5-phosphate-3-epimerase
LIEIDGGVNQNNAAKLFEAGLMYWLPEMLYSLRRILQL